MIRNTTVLILDDENNYLFILEELLTEDGYTVQTFNDPELALLWLEKEHADIVITDLKMPKLSGKTVVNTIHKNQPDIPIIVITAFGSIENAVDFMKEGVFNYITKPFDNNDILLSVRGASELAFARKQYRSLYEKVSSEHNTADIIAHSSSMQTVMQTLQHINTISSPVFLHGERGTGKQYIAQQIHNQSMHSDGEFISLTCEVNDALWLEKQLFGHIEQRGSGSYRHIGLLEKASGGTIYIDSIDNLPSTLQIQLLQYYQQPSPESTVVPRLIASTAGLPADAVKAGTLREELYYFINVISIAVPTLRERREDIPYLATQIINQFTQKQQTTPKTFTPEAIRYLSSYEWYGNIDELQTVLERTAIFTKEDTIDVPNLPAELQEEETRFSSAVDLLPISLNLADTLERIEAQLIRRALVHTNFVQSRAAQLLGISKSRLQYKLMKYEIAGHQLTY